MSLALCQEGLALPNGSPLAPGPSVPIASQPQRDISSGGPPSAPLPPRGGRLLLPCPMCLPPWLCVSGSTAGVLVKGCTHGGLHSRELEDTHLPVGGDPVVGGPGGPLPREPLPVRWPDGVCYEAAGCLNHSPTLYVATTHALGLFHVGGSSLSPHPLWVGLLLPSSRCPMVAPESSVQDAREGRARNASSAHPSIGGDPAPGQSQECWEGRPYRG